MPRDTPYNRELIASLKEREKEMKCLYMVQEIINRDPTINELLSDVVKQISRGWQYPNITRVKITYKGKVFVEEGWDETNWVHSANIIIDEKILGKIEVYYIESAKLIGISPFLPEEQKLLNTIASNISSFIYNKMLTATLEVLNNDKDSNVSFKEDSDSLLPIEADIHWRWRFDTAKLIADRLDFKKYGVKAFYLIGSAKNATSGPASDIDILLHFRGNDEQKKLLHEWFEGWSYGLDELNFYKTGHRVDGLIDLHLITDKDIENKDSFASMIGAVNDGARLLKSREND